MSSPLPYNTEISQHRYSVPPVPIPMLPSPPERMQVVPVAAVLRRRCRHRALLLLLPQALLPHHHVLLPHVIGAALLPGQPVLHRVSRVSVTFDCVHPAFRLNSRLGRLDSLLLPIGLWPVIAEHPAFASSLAHLCTHSSLFFFHRSVYTMYYKGVGLQGAVSYSWFNAAALTAAGTIGVSAAAARVLSDVICLPM